MSSLAILVVVFAAKAFVQGGGQVPCGGASAGEADVWDRARSPVTAAFCDKLAQGSARLGRDPAAALAAAEEAETLVPDQAAAAVLRGRALVDLRRFAEAKETLERGATLDAQTLAASPALLALARAQRGTGSPAAVGSYRALVPRVDGLATQELRSRALLEAGQALLGEGPPGAPEAIAVFERLAGSGDLSTRTRAKAWLALALDRSDRGAEAAFLATAAAREGGVALVTERDAADPTHAAVLAILLAEREPARSSALFRAYLEGPGGKSPWAAHTRARLEALSKARGASPPGRGKSAATKPGSKGTPAP